MSIWEFEDFLVFHQAEIGAATDLAIEVQIPKGATMTCAVTDVTVANERLVIHAVPLPD
jgi:hypothetical protein